MRKPSVINIVSKEVFQVALVTYLVLTLAETLKEGYVSNFFNLNYLLLVVLITGVAMVLTEPNEELFSSDTIRKRAISSYAKIPAAIRSPQPGSAIYGATRRLRRYKPGQRRRTIDGF